MNPFTTFTGLSLAEAAQQLDAELPPDAYSKVPGAVDLTDIDPAHMRHTLNTVFGLCGVGWGYDFAVADLEVTLAEKSALAVCRRLTFWFKLRAGEETHTCVIPATGASENRNPQYAMKGALTNALGNAVSNLGFQESVYMGKRSHASVGRKPTPAGAPKPAAPAPRPAAPMPEAKPVNGANGAAQPVNGHAQPPAPASPAADPGAFVIAVGTQHKGKAVKDLPASALIWFAEKMAATTPAAQAAKEACMAYLAAHPELRTTAEHGVNGGVKVPA